MRGRFYTSRPSCLFFLPKSKSRPSRIDNFCCKHFLCDSGYCKAGNFRQEFNFVAFVKAVFWLNQIPDHFFSQNHKCGIRNIHECEDKCEGNKRRPNDRRTNERRPKFDINNFLTNCLTVAFDEIFRWRKFPDTVYCKRFIWPVWALAPRELKFLD